VGPFPPTRPQWYQCQWMVEFRNVGLDVDPLRFALIWLSDHFALGCLLGRSDFVDLRAQ
jgi:hypothetical protein